MHGKLNGCYFWGEGVGCSCHSELGKSLTYVGKCIRLPTFVFCSGKQLCTHIILPFPTLSLNKYYIIHQSVKLCRDCICNTGIPKQRKAST